MSAWRVDRHYAVHVYEGEMPVATFHRPEDAARAVAAVNAEPASSGRADVTPDAGEYTVELGGQTFSQGQWEAVQVLVAGTDAELMLDAAVWSATPSADFEALRRALRAHHPTMRSETGPFSGCRCGQVGLGEDVIAHVSDQLTAALDAAR